MSYSPVTSPLSLDQHDFITTYTGKRVNVFALRPEDVCIEDIAHALSQLCRFTGHCREFYSVAEHCWLASYVVSPGLALEALLHDAAEAYVNDLSRPLKHHPCMTVYREVEHQVDTAVRAHFGLPIYRLTPHMSDEVKDADNKLVVTEARKLMADSGWTDGLLGYYPATLMLFEPKMAEQQFMSRFYELGGD